MKAVIRIWNTNVRVYFIPYFYLKARLKSMFNILIHTTKRTQYVGLSIWKTDDRNVTIDRQNFWMFSEDLINLRKISLSSPLKCNLWKLQTFSDQKRFHFIKMTYFRKKIHLHQEEIYAISRNSSQLEFSYAMLRELQKKNSN